MYAMTSNPLLQSLEGFFKGLIEQVRIYLGCIYRPVSQRLLNDEDVRGASIQSGCKAMPERMRRDSLIDSSFDDPLIETALDLTGGDSLLQLAEEEGLRISEDLLAFFQVSMQNRAQLGVEKASDGLSPLGLNGDPLLQQIDVGDVQTNQLRQPDACMQEQVDNHQIAVCLPALLRSDGFQEQAFFVFGHENGWLCVLVFDLNPDGGIVIDLTDVGQPSEESFDRGPGAIDGRIQFRLTIGLVCHWTRKKEAIDISGAYLPDFAVITKMVAQQFQIALLRSDSVRRSAVGKLVIQEEFYCVIECHDSSSVSDSSRGCQLQIDWLVMYKRTFAPMNLLIGAVILRSPISWKLSRFSWKSTVAIELEYRIDFTWAIRVSYISSVMLGLLSLSRHTDEFTLVGNAEFREITGFKSYPSGRSFQLVTCGDARQLESVRFTIHILFQVTEAVKLPTEILRPFDELLFFHCGLLLWFGLVTKFTVQGCAGIRSKVKVKNEINVTVRW